MNRRVLLGSLVATAGCPRQPCRSTISEEQIEGPYYLLLALDRQDITEDRGGLPLQLEFTVVDEDCWPLANALVEVWHADAEGDYSGFGDTEGETWLRGSQLSDDEGRVAFTTIVPGLYTNRTSHLHVRVAASGFHELVTQLYFSDEVNDALRTEYGPGDTFNAGDAYYEPSNEVDSRPRRGGFEASATLELVAR